MTGPFLCSVFGLVSVVSVDCAAPWRLQVNPALSWFHFINPLMLLLLYNTVANLWRNQVTPATLMTFGVVLSGGGRCTGVTGAMVVEACGKTRSSHQ